MTVTVVNPATEEIIATLPSAGVEETDAAVAAARTACPGWRAVSPRDRGRLLRRLAALVEEHGEELSRIESQNVGKPIAGARGEIGMVADVFHFYAGAVDKKHGETIPVAGGVDLTFREPLGVVGLIVPWNFPLTIAAWKVAPALAAGNTVVLKPAEQAPACALALYDAFRAAGLPAGALHVLPGGDEPAKALVSHPHVHTIAFTGSGGAGRDILRRAAEVVPGQHHLKRVVCEMGGKNIVIVDADADVDDVVPALMRSAFAFAGQKCSAAARVLVH
nr:aldehyde dehydrogenase family protein [Actinomycetota bacterium]